MGKWIFAFLLVVLAGCDVVADVEPSACTEPYIPYGFKEGCCLDANGDGVCDAYEDAEMKSEREIELPADAPVVADVNESEDQQHIEIAEQIDYLQEYRSLYGERVQAMGYRQHVPGYGYLNVLVGPSMERYVTDGQLFGIREPRTIVPSDYEHYMHTEQFYDKVRNKEVEALNYIFWDSRHGEYHGCFVDRGRYSQENCITANGESLVYYGVDFDPPLTPGALLDRYGTLRPERIEDGHLYVTGDGSSIRVDLLYYAHEDGTTTRLTIHEGYGAPLEVATLREGKVVERLAFEVPLFNSEASRWFDRLVREYPSND